MTKKVLLLAAAALLGLAACNKTSVPTLLPGSGDQESGEMCITLLPQTKVASADARFSQIQSVQVFIFKRPGGTREADRYTTDASEIGNGIKLSTLTGDKTVWAVINAPKLFVSTEEELKTKTSALKDNALTKVVMSGYNDQVSVVPYDAGNPDGTRTAVHINVSRLGARVSLQKVIVDFRGTALEGCNFTIKDLYLKNVVNGVRYDGASPSLTAESMWSNRFTWVSSDTDALLGDRGLAIACNSNGSVPEEENVGRSWYVYPNPTEADAVSAAWSARHTRLVLHASVSGTMNGAAYNKEHTYYVFTLPVIEGNHTYDVQSIKISMLGKDNDDDDSLTASGKVDVSVSVNAWDEEVTLNYEL